jgi:hypothetical protein
MTLADYIVGTILIVIILWALVKMPRRASREIFAAILRASSLLSNFAAERQSGSLS